MTEPPEVIDGARVICWASSRESFFVMTAPDGSVAIPIHGLAIARYEGGQVYRFSCNERWEVENDTDFDSVEEAMIGRSAQYEISQVAWRKRTSVG